jgi:predicted RNase H-like nuclease (RuvC/YqgF family)
MSIPEGSVVITPIEVYREVQATHQAVQQLLGKLDTFVGTQSDHETRLRKVDDLPRQVEELKTDSEEHDKRIGHLETRMAMYAGASGVLGTAAGYLASWAIFGHH